MCDKGRIAFCHRLALCHRSALRPPLRARNKPKCVYNNIYSSSIAKWLQHTEDNLMELFEKARMRRWKFGSEAACL